MVVDYNLAGIEEVAAVFLKEIGDRKVIAFHGEMGAGKTTFIHAVCDRLQVEDVIGSPTFSIINEYRTAAADVVFHLDLYRLKDEAEAIAAGVEDCLFSGNLCMVEWPDRAPGIFPEDTVHCYLKSVTDKGRNLRINL